MKFYASTVKHAVRMNAVTEIKVTKRKLAAIYEDNIKSTETHNNEYNMHGRRGIGRGK